MKSIYFSELADFVNDENLNFKGKEIRQGNKKADLSKYDDMNKRVLFSKYTSLVDLVNLDDELLRYNMGFSGKMKMFNIIMQAKGLINDLMPEFNVEIKTSDRNEYDFSVYILIEEEYNKYSKMKISTNRSYEIIIPTENDKVIEVFDMIKTEFLKLASTP